MVRSISLASLSQAVCSPRPSNYPKSVACIAHGSCTKAHHGALRGVEDFSRRLQVNQSSSSSSGREMSVALAHAPHSAQRLAAWMSPPKKRGFHLCWRTTSREEHRRFSRRFSHRAEPRATAYHVRHSFPLLRQRRCSNVMTSRASEVVDLDVSQFTAERVRELRSYHAFWSDPSSEWWSALSIHFQTVVFVSSSCWKIIWEISCFPTLRNPFFKRNKQHKAIEKFDCHASALFL